MSRNAVIKLTSEVIGRAATFVLVLWAARQLGEAGFGLYNYGLALGFVLAQIADLGLQVLISREVAVVGLEARPLVLRALRLKILLSLPVVLLLAIFTAGWPGLLRLSLITLGLVALGQTYLEFVAYVFRGQQLLTIEATILAAVRLITAVIGGIILALGGELWGLALGSVLSTIIMVAWALWLLRQAGWLSRIAGSANGQQANRQPLYRTRPYYSLIKQTMPIGISIFLSIAYTRLAILMLQFQLDEVAVAHFSAAYRLVEPSQILPASLLAAAFPAFTYALHHNPRQARQIGRRVSLLLAVLGAGVAATFWLAAPWLVPLLYGEQFIASVNILKVLGFSSIAAFINYSLTHYLIARGQQVYIGLFTGAMLLLHATLSWRLIPSLGPLGPAVSIVLAECLLLVCCLFILILTKARAAVLNNDY